MRIFVTVFRKIEEKMYDYLGSDAVLPNKPKGCDCVNLGTKDQLLFDKAVLKTARKESIVWLWSMLRVVANTSH